ncbi:LrgB family protein [Acidaminobacter sp. JC074]|uniref:LrgB family protein n=1 Tax=Acidaminobacter sp. JC074 TaxID=2530199 RepID=UPI001F0FB280|nr:LrgB family protein [Acidaminobacter sp. JC074]MCH4886086.1 LrgB family protein [Acidaminobacter sp. JC074]
MIGLILTLVYYVIALQLKKRFKSPLLNPVLVAVAFLIMTIIWTPLDYDTYIKGGKLIGDALGPVVVLLALPLYRHRDAIKTYFAPIVIGILVSISSSVLVIIGLGTLFGLDLQLIKTLIPKSITTPMAMEVSSMLGGLSDITVIVVIITGILGATIAPIIMKLAKTKSDIAKGIAIGSASHGIGTSKAMEMSGQAGAMSGLAMGLTGVIFVLLTSLYVLFI